GDGFQPGNGFSGHELGPAGGSQPVAGSSLTGGSGSGALTPTRPDGTSQASSSGIPSSMEESRRGRSDGTDSGDANLGGNIVCGQGAGKIADVGRTQAHEGSADNVFATCEGDFR